jgi:hypothetical protein
MKKIILSVFALAAFGFANAQDNADNGGKGFQNGDIFVTGSVGFSSEKTGDAKENSFNISPKVGFFVTENIAIGGQIGYTNTTTDAGAGETKTNEFSVGAFGRYYWTPASDFSLFAQLGVNYNTEKSEFEGEETGKTNGFDIALAPGISYFVGSNWAIEASIGALSYETSKPDADGADSTNTFGLDIDFTNVNIGVLYKF